MEQMVTSLVQFAPGRKVIQTEVVPEQLAKGLFRLLQLTSEDGPLGDLARSLELLLAGLGVPSSKVMWTSMQMVLSAMHEILKQDGDEDDDGGALELVPVGDDEEAPPEGEGDSWGDTSASQSSSIFRW